MEQPLDQGGKGARWLAVSVVVLVLGAAGALVVLMKQASRPAALEAEGSASGDAPSPVAPGRDAPSLPPPHRKLGQMPVVSEDRVVLNGLVPEAKACLGLDGSAPGAVPDLGTDSGYLGVLLEVEPSGRPARAAATSFAGARVPEAQATCIAAALLKLQFSRASSTRLLQRRYYLGGGAPPVEPPIPEQVTDAALASSLSALGEVGTLCPSLLNQQPASLAAWGAQVIFGPEGEPAWRVSEPTIAPDAATCLNEALAKLRLPATQFASQVSIQIDCAAGRCNLTGSVAQTAEAVE